ncbi:MAG: hypothetical protein PHD70_11260 [Anaerostipes sp.]|jgi:hypothetical protein|nr:hypothetical protein [Anaerostipes sp.]MDD3747034.1 hypothetical protein [Anaerostipes sp.]
MHSLWQEKINFPEYPTLKKDQETDIVYIGATLKNAVEGHFAMEQGQKVILIEEKCISQMKELGGMGIIKGETKEEIRDLHRLQDYIAGRNILCDMEVESDSCIWVHPVKLFLYLTRDMKVYEHTKVQKIKNGKIDVGSAYIKAEKWVKAKKETSFYIHAFQRETFPEIKGNYQVMRSYKNWWLIGNDTEYLDGEDYHWKV